MLGVVNATITPPWNSDLGIIFARISRTSSVLTDADMPILFKSASPPVPVPRWLMFLFRVFKRMSRSADRAVW
ncbi:hypothetical protein BDZ89DRAFT_305697 [Hymenopellis radicata]|nr:hypothetical protein BDZ89DRAFT_305697 [Hymenopellis radicata]